ncbi:hypothetical protein P3X46_033252 [Hevea brasiliensis]|uniref:Dof zinc finger protein n=1 Tax=Hevea brasiliensis TaxID=3981 RepID=A0ABQ9KJ16_HEVBR|nr:dof zinc finger protein DOF1.4 [Hevea brasiliensis]XP_021635057.2 dof zinc finger protein DOF1.4 [Hevea brasiliensis]XP_021635058.2 dof zinc finger protein DOF1.4 [Hevea brasiliensis]KAJ9136144.1 hypothetical protein P3X46_033252 [Hevea brasiliensis]KAJ9136145.1 hypothetical protein P3X46_033252 [Hevea brasiliensis]KAJ9136146.1 hypothetical protein P3X46_033252 [Hevea brasiliensis]
MRQDKGGSEEIMKQNQDRRLKPMQVENQQQQQHQPQKCPRCDSLNTKFCYYNNYSLSQPRYFCKTCRRYWTQGGTLRNVPVGGSSRKGKRGKTSSSSTSSSFTENSTSQSQPQPLSLGSSENIMSTTNSGNIATSTLIRTKESSGNLVLPPGISSMGSYYSGGGFLTSLATIQSLNNQPPQSLSLNQAVNLGGDLGVTSNLSLLNSFNAFGSQQQQQIQQQRQIYHIGNRENKSGDHPFCGSSSQSQQQHRCFVNTINPTVSDTSLWSISTSSTTGTTNNNSTITAGSFPLNAPADQWHDLSGYGPPP